MPETIILQPKLNHMTYSYISDKNHFHLIVQNKPDQLLVALQAADLSSVGVNEVIQVQVQLWPDVHDVSNDSSQSELLLSARHMLVGLVVAVQHLEEQRGSSS